jgi:phosphoserine phosphatase
LIISFQKQLDISYCDKQPTCRDGGKARVVQQLKDELGLVSVVMVGDGVTDMQAKPPADAVIGE